MANIRQRRSIAAPCEWQADAEPQIIRIDGVDLRMFAADDAGHKRGPATGRLGGRSILANEANWRSQPQAAVRQFKLGSVIRLFDLPAPEQSSRRMPGGRQCGDEVDERAVAFQLQPGAPDGLVRSTLVPHLRNQTVNRSECPRLAEVGLRRWRGRLKSSTPSSKDLRCSSVSWDKKTRTTSPPASTVTRSARVNRRRMSSVVGRDRRASQGTEAAARCRRPSPPGAARARCRVAGPQSRRSACSRLTSDLGDTAPKVAAWWLERSRRSKVGSNRSQWDEVSPTDGPWRDFRGALLSLRPERESSQRCGHLATSNLQAPSPRRARPRLPPGPQARESAAPPNSSGGPSG